ncbi:hypothetical protein BDE40_1986 [Litoreibacter halocynthiae]|uniref:Peptidase M15C domain-containing protein n=1 Tax=Litoreibacter halocynthiae TaxID=1242689 RepID=A0A4R7LHM3_9RHOB|nr:M15 family metallopeptidase [Litoreibacter halocynthiae]TDT75258.1 hypothetical protein BDE40_1986 [Litoreibacter halocynthiae]
MDTAAIKLVQSKLKEMGHYSGRIDGDRGPKTHAAVKKGIPQIGGTPPAGWKDLSGKRQSIMFLQLYCHSNDIDAGTVDGFWGPQTSWAADALDEKLQNGFVHAWRDVEPIEANPHQFPKQSQMTNFYGPHGIPGGRSPELVSVPCPWPLKIAWNKSQRRSGFKVHKKVADSLGEIVERVHDHYGLKEIERLGFDLFGGDYNPRKMRGGSSWSTHSWGIAIDFDPERNRLKWGRGRASFAHPDCADFWEIWERQGWTSLGRVKNFDWMHVQAARLG